MKEIFAPQPESSLEAEPDKAEIRKELERNLEKIEETRDILISCVELLEQNIPHNDVIADDTTYAYDVAHNALSARVYECDVIQDATRGLLDQLEAA